MVFEEAFLFSDTIRANIAYGRPEASDDELWQALDKARLGALVRALPDQLDTMVERLTRR